MQQQWITRDTAVNWHPYSQMKTTTHLPIVKGEDAYLYDAQGKKYLDMVSSWWVTLHGHANRYIADKVYEQLCRLEQVIFAGFTHEPAVVLSERLLALLPDNQQKIFYSDNGSTAVEVALKMCVQYAVNNEKKKTKILAFSGGYHGDTFGAMAVSERGQWTAPFSDMLFQVMFVDPPHAQNIEQTKALISRHAHELACFIYEPLVQGAGGMQMHQAVYLTELMKHCRSCGVLLIQDEVFVGFGRTGTLFAADQLEEKPDIMCFSKGLTGGTMPMGITSCSDEIYFMFYADQKTKALFHGHSFTANPVACAASLASLDLLLLPSTMEKIGQISASHKRFVSQLRSRKKAVNVRQAGTIVAFDWDTGGKPGYFNTIQNTLYNAFLDRGIILRPLGNVVYILPPYCTQQEELDYTYQTILEMLDRDQI